jgi:WD40 repeat protein
VRNFERAAVTDTCAAFAHLGAIGSQREISFTRYHNPNSSWKTFPIGINTAVTSVAIGGDFTYVLTPGTIVRTDVGHGGATELFSVPNSPHGILTAVPGGVAVAFNTLSRIVYLSSHGTIGGVNTPYPGFSALATFGDDFLCGVSGSTVIRLLSKDGDEGQLFVGHCGKVNEIAALGDRSFASGSLDATVRVWDLRYRFPVVSIATHGIAVKGVTGTAEFLICALENGTVNAFDLRKPMGKAVLGVETQECEPVNLSFSQTQNELAVFGLHKSEQAKAPSLIPELRLGNPGIFRVYTKFLEVK